MAYPNTSAQDIAEKQDEIDQLQEENKQLREILYKLANYITLHVRHNDNQLAVLTGEAVLASYKPEDDED